MPKVAESPVYTVVLTLASSQLYQASAITLTIYFHQELYNYYQVLLSSPRYLDRPSKAAKATAEGCKVDVSTVYRALRATEQ